MKKLVLGAVAAAAMLAPGLAHAETNAVIGLNYNSLDSDGFDMDTHGLTGAFNHDFANGWQVQVDGAAQRLDLSGCCIGENYLAVHYGKRTDTYSFAGFLGTQDWGYVSGISVGVEGQMHFAQASIGGSISYVDFGDYPLNGTNIDVNGSYYFNPNFSVGADIDYTDNDIGDWTSYGISGEYRFDNSPASVTLGYRQIDVDSTDLDMWSIGVNFDLGTGSLQDRRAHGPSWDGASSLNNGFGLFGGVA